MLNQDNYAAVTDILRNGKRYFDELAAGETSKVVALKNNKPAAVLLSPAEYERLLNQSDFIGERRLMKALFVQQRMHILDMGVNRNEFTNSYLYAWYAGVYPALSDRGEDSNMPHAPYSEFFSIREDEVLHLANLLDDRWLKKKVPTFYELEDEFGVRMGSSNYDRSSLIRICRYMWLDRLFDDDFWSVLLKPMEHPSEAKSITYEFKRDEIYWE